MENNGQNILIKWADEFNNLYNTLGSIKFNQLHLHQISDSVKIYDKQQLEENQYDADSDGNIFVGAGRINGIIITVES